MLSFSTHSYFADSLPDVGGKTRLCCIQVVRAVGVAAWPKNRKLANASRAGKNLSGRSLMDCWGRFGGVGWGGGSDPSTAVCVV